MRILIIGGTAFTGPALIQELLEHGHEVTYMHRGNTNDDRTAGANELILDRRDNAELTAAISSVPHEVLVDMVPFLAEDAEVTKQACKEAGSRVVAISSIDAYHAYGLIKKTEFGPIQPTPLTEQSELRTSNPDGPERDKLSIERIYMTDEELRATILRLPAIYGPRDKLRRLRGYLKRMDDERPAILRAQSLSTWKFSRGYTDNVAHAIALAVENEKAAGELFNVGEPHALTEMQFVQTIAKAAGWHGEIEVIADDQLPTELQPDVNFEQDWEVDTQKIRSQLGYCELIEQDDAFLRTVQWERANPPEVEPYPADYQQEDEVLAAHGD
jgi:nucleoside-diphosphate-sugar epimerase